MDLANKSVTGARLVHPFRDIEIGSTSDTFDVDVAGGVVVARLVAAVVDSDCVLAMLGVRDDLRKRHANKDCGISKALNECDKFGQLTTQGRR
jgi:hypothetical protein